MPLILALDQSTSATKALLFDQDGRALDKESREHRQHYPSPGWVEHDAEEIWQNTLAVLQGIATRNQARLDEVLCLSITNQRETIVVFERGTGRPLYRAMVWQCRRGDPLCAEMLEKGRGELIRQKTGLRVDSYFSGSKLLWLVRNHPEIARKLETGEALVGTIDAYLVYRLSEGRVFATDFTNASRTLLFNIGTLAWDEELCGYWQIPLKALPEVRESSARFGETNLGGSLKKALPICGVMGDSQASLFAQRCFSPGEAKVTFGTGSSILLNIGETLRHSERGVVTALAWVYRGKPTYAFEGIIISSAATLTWLKDQLGITASAAEADRLAASISSNEGVYLVPAFSGLGFPHWKPEARAAIVGLSSQSDKRHVLRAALESISYQLRDALEAMRAEAGVALSGLHGDGGPTASKILMQFTADLTRTEMRISSMPDCSPFGAALSGMLGMGLHKDLQAIAALPQQETRYLPQLPLDEAERNYKGWLRAVQRVL